MADMERLPSMREVCDKRVAILMATYNGGKYLNEQLESLAAQSFQDWTLFVRDDGSTDDTLAILEHFSQRLAGKVVLIEDDLPIGRGACRNFAAIHAWVSKYYEFDFYMFADQDDVWLVDKIAKNVACLCEEHKKTGGAILVHSDLSVVNDELVEISSSFFSYRSINGGITDLNRLVAQNNVTGCTMAWNKELNDLITLNHDEIAMHDWWVALVAASFGRTICLKEPLVLYRQHADNVVGATKVDSISFVVRRLSNISHIKKTILKSKLQTQCFLSEYSNVLPSDHANTLEGYVYLFDRPKPDRVLRLIRGRYLKQGLVQAIGQLAFA